MVGLALVLFLVADEAEIGGGNGHGAGCRQLAVALSANLG